MKKFLSMTLVVAMMAVSSVTAFAAAEFTTTTSATTANAGDEVVISETLNTTNGVATMGIKFKFSLNDFELGTSDKADGYAVEYADLIGTPDFPTLDSVCETMDGVPSHVADAFITTHGSYADKQKYTGASTKGAYEEKDGYGYVTFAHANDSAKNALNKTDNYLVGAVVLKAKTTDKKEATIEVVEASYSGSNLVDTPVTCNSVTIALNGYTAGGDDDTLKATKAEAANGANTNTYTFENSDAMAGKKVVMQNAKMPTTGMTAKTRFIVSDGTRTQTFGSDIWAKLGAEGDGVIDVANVIFGIIVDADNTSTFTFTVE